jgi:hypothetical protein
MKITCSPLKFYQPIYSKKNIFLLMLNFLIPLTFFAQQVPDTSFRFANIHPAYQEGKGPLVMIDAAHYNFHTKEGGFYAFAKLLEQGGYRVESLDNLIQSDKTLNSCKILVIANALNEVNDTNWVLPTPSAFTKNEIVIIKKWVENGGSLLLIADHMPFAGAAYELGKAFGFEYINGFAYTGERTWPPSKFSLKNGTLAETNITKGIHEYEKIDSVSTFTGSAILPPDNAIPILIFQKENISRQPDTAWQFHEFTPSISLEGYCQGAIMQFGKGKVAMFGEAAMFTAQIVNGNFPVGINSPAAPQNAQFVLNLIHWLENTD